MARISADLAGSLDQAVRVLSDGGLVAFPTDTLYGLGALVSLPAAIERLFEAKDRQRDKAIPVLIASIGDLEKVAAGVPETVNRLAAAFWPGPLTIVVPRREDLPSVLGPTSTVGVRVPNHPVALALLRQAGPLAVTSANRSGGQGCQTAEQVEQALAGKVDLILDGGRCPGGQASTVIECTGREVAVLREGPIGLESLQSVLAGDVS